MDQPDSFYYLMFAVQMLLSIGAGLCVVIAES